jgi:hypothetical protein
MVGRRGPGLVGTMATAAVIGGTAAATSHAIDRRMTRKDNERAAEQEAQYAAVQNQADMQAMQEQMAEMQAQQAQMAMQAQMAQAAPPPAPAPVAAPAGDDLMTKLNQLTQLKQAGALTDEEFAAAKAKLLA